MKFDYCTLYIVRHGQSQANYPSDLYGLDRNLTEKGKEQAKNASKQFKKMKFDAIISSPLVRAKETAEIIAAELKLAVSTKEMLRDRKFGKLEGRQTKEVKEELKELFAEIDQQNKAKKKPTEQEILNDIQTYRRLKRETKGA